MWAIGKAHRAPTRGHPTPPQRDAGFTLIEALVVMAIAGLIAGIGFPMVTRAINGWQFRASIAEIRAAVEDARAQSLRTGRMVGFTVDAAQRRYGIAGGATRTLDPSVRLAASPAVIIFHGDGSASGGRFSLSSSGREATLTVDADTGLIGTPR